MTEKKINTVKASIDISLTSDEAYEIVHNPKGKVAKEFRKYLSELMYGIGKLCLKKHEQIKAAEAVDGEIH